MVRISACHAEDPSSIPGRGVHPQRDSGQITRRVMPVASTWGRVVDTDRLVRFSWSYGVTVSTLDSESSDRGSNPRRTFRFSQTGVEQ